MDDDRSDRYDDHDRVTSWASAGSWDDDPAPPPPPAPPPAPPKKRPLERPFRAFRVPVDGRALVAGRFDPPHRGHEYVIAHARQATTEITVAVFTSAADAVPGDLRVAWLLQRFAAEGVKVVEVPGAEPNLAPERFAAMVSAATGGARFEWLFSSEADAAPAAAKALGATYVPVDPKREAVPVSGRAIRADPMGRFDDLLSVTRPWVVRRVAVVGAESTGKSTLCRRLAEIYGTVHVPEQARAIADARGGDLDVDGLELAARSQSAAEAALVVQARRVLFCDTDLESLVMWSERIYGAHQDDLPEAANRRPYDLTLVCNADVPFVGARERDRPKERVEFDASIRRTAKARTNTVVLHGSWEKRLLEARKAIDQLLARKDLLSARGEAMIPPRG